MLVGIVLIVLLVLVLKNAWFSDDAMITFRTVVNAANGYGLTWNIDERVQAYTHPLWMLLLTGSYLLTHEIYFTCICLSLLCTAGALLLIGMGVARSHAGLIAASAALISAKSFIDYSTSGLENPVSHLLIAAFCVSYLRPSAGRLWLTALCGGLLALSRIDLLVLVAPALAVAALAPSWPRVRAGLAEAKGLPGRLHALLGLVRLRAIGALALGMLPLLTWEIFSLIYYGFLVPNTAYAKLNTGISQSDLYAQGVLYLLDSIRIDPVTLLVIGAGALVPLLARSWRSAALSLGIGLYLLYVLRIGGDFMSGRFLTAPLVVAAIVIAAELRARPAYLLAMVVAALGLLNPRGPLSIDNVDLTTAEATTTEKGLQGVVDERAYYMNYRSVLMLARNPEASNDPYVLGGRLGSVQVVNVTRAIGMYGLTVGPSVHVVDVLALSDPLLARLPAIYDPQWRIGHFVRQVPAGYVETLERGENHIQDKDLAAYYDQLHLITSGPLFSRERWAAIWGMLTGAYDSLIDVERYRYPEQLRLHYDEIASPSNDRSANPIPQGGVLIDLGGPRSEGALELTFTHEQRLRLQCLRGGQVVYQADLSGPHNPLRPLDLLVLDLPRAAMGYDYIRLLPLRLGQADLGHLRLIGPGDAPAPEFRLGGGWYAPFNAPEVLAVAPSSIFVTSSLPQPYWLDLTPAMIYDPEAPKGRGSSGVLIVQTSAGYTTTVAIKSGTPVSLPLDLPPGSQRIDLSLAAGVYQPFRYFGDRDVDFSFSFSSIRLRTLSDINLPADILIDGQPQRAAGGALIVLPDDGWYAYEEASGLRWAGPPARLQIYSPAEQTVRIRLALRYISDGQGPGGEGALTVVTNGTAEPPAPAWTWQPFVASLALRPGWNSVDLRLSAPPFRPSAADGASPDSRELSIGVSRLELLTRP